MEVTFKVARRGMGAVETGGGKSPQRVFPLEIGMGAEGDTGR